MPGSRVRGSEATILFFGGEFCRSVNYELRTLLYSQLGVFFCNLEVG
jgi:hypothetical protein